MVIFLLLGSDSLAKSFLVLPLQVLLEPLVDVGALKPIELLESLLSRNNLVSALRLKHFLHAQLLHFVVPPGVQKTVLADGGCMIGSKS